MTQIFKIKKKELAEYTVNSCNDDIKLININSTAVDKNLELLFNTVTVINDNDYFNNSEDNNLEYIKNNLIKVITSLSDVTSDLSRISDDLKMCSFINECNMNSDDDSRSDYNE